MQYKGKLYGQIGRRGYFDTGKTSADWDRMMADVKRLDWLQAQEVKRALETGTHGKDFDYLVMAEDGTTCWGKTYRAAIDDAMKAFEV